MESCGTVGFAVKKRAESGRAQTEAVTTMDFSAKANQNQTEFLKVKTVTSLKQSVTYASSSNRIIT